MVIQQPKKLKMASPFSGLAETYEAIFPAMRLYAADAVALAPPITSESVVHDNGCGPGVVAAEILARFHSEQALQYSPSVSRSPSPSNDEPPEQEYFPPPPPPPRIVATDISPAMTSAAARRGPSIAARVLDSRYLDGIDPDTFTHSFSNFVILGMSTLDMGRVVSEMHRTLRPGGTAVLTAWRALDYVSLFEDLARRVNPSGKIDTRDVAVLSERRLEQVLMLGGFRPSYVKVTSITRAMRWKLWTEEGYAAIRKSMCDGFTRGWRREDSMKLDDAMRDMIERLAEQGASYRMTAWVVLMRK